MSFAGAAFAETPFATDSEIRAGSFGGSLVVMHFNKSFLTFPLQINKLANFDLKINTQQAYSLNMNKILEFTTRR